MSAAAVLVASLFGPAEPTSSSLRWDAPPECPSEDDVVARVEQLLGAPLAEPRAVAIDATAVVTADAEGTELTLRLTIVSASGERERLLSGGDCEGLAEIAAVLVAVAIDPGAATRTEIEPAPAPPPAPVVEPERAVEAASPTTPQQPDPDRVGGAVRLATGVDIASLPSPAPLLGLTMALRWRTLRAELGIEHRFARRIDVPDSDGRVELWATVGVASMCWAPRIPRVEFPVCGGIEAGAFAGRSRGIVSPATRRGPWAAFRLGGGLVVLPWKRFGITVDAKVVLPVTRTGFAIEGVGELHRASAAAGQFTAGAEARFP